MEVAIVLSLKFNWSHKANYRRLTTCSLKAMGFIAFARSSYRRSSNFAIVPLYLLSIVGRSSSYWIYQSLPPLSARRAIYSREGVIGSVGDGIGPYSSQVIYSPHFRRWYDLPLISRLGIVFNLNNNNNNNNNNK